MSVPKPRLALTLGDPAGIGPEVVLKVLADPWLQSLADITVIGDEAALWATFTHLDLPLQHLCLPPHCIPLLDCQVIQDPHSILLGVGNGLTGEASFRYLNTAIEKTLAGHFDAIVTAPIAKFAWRQAGHHFPGQTEVLAHLSKSPRYGMFFVARSPYTEWQLRVLLATTHIPLRQVADALTPDLIRQKLDLLLETLREGFGISQPVIAVSGLNPHSGEAGQLGREEQEWLTPLLRTYGDRILGDPIPPDTLWLNPSRAWYQDPMLPGIADAYLALYHDQGLIPVKMLAFDRAVNMTIGLPFVRTSPDHGTAFDIAGKGIARPDSLKAALQLAAELTQIKPGGSIP